jgi:hypothetical protein
MKKIVICSKKLNKECAQECPHGIMHELSYWCDGHQITCPDCIEMEFKRKNRYEILKSQVPVAQFG